MREILFRAWDKTSNKNGVMISWEDLKKCKCEDVFINLSEVELMQYTGLEDKNGVKIFEGDTATIKSKTNTSYNAIVCFNRSKFCFYLTDCGEHEYPYRDLYGWVSIEITGNIHES